MSADYEFSIRRSWAAILAGCLATVSILLFLAGTVTGLLYSDVHGEAIAVVPAPPVETRAKVAPDKSLQNPVEPAPVISATEPSDTVAPASVAAATTPPTSAATPSITPPTVPAKTAESSIPTPPSTALPNAIKPVKSASVVDPEAVAPPASKISLAIPLAVQVGAFSIKSNAETLVQSLGDQGYKPLVSRSTDARGRLWYIVRLGPYDKWTAASRVAARISLTENVKPTIGPMR